MPLQKSPSHGTRHLDGHARERPLQKRRRTLQTISELAVTDNMPPNFSARPQLANNGRSSYTKASTMEKKPQSLNKRRSMPQYCSSPACLRAQVLSAAEIMHTEHSQSGSQHALIASTDVVQRGWNARRERARIQREHAIGDANSPQQNSAYHGWIGSEPLLPKGTPLSISHTSQHYLKSHTSHPRSLRNSRSVRGYPQTIERRAGFGGTTRSAGYHGFDTESTGRVSTDSSSHRSSHDDPSRRSHLSPSQSPVTAQAALPPLPKALIPRRQRYYSNPANSHNGLIFGQPPIPQNARPNSTTRSSSMPSIRIEDLSGTHQRSQRSISRPPHSSTEKEHEISIQKARLATLAALTASPNDFTQEPHTRHPSSRTRTRSTPSLRSPPPACTRESHSNSPNTYTTTATTNTYTLPLQTNKLMHEHAALTPRAMPKRESLTQWKAEREEAKIEFGITRKADVKERVRRANELEMEREKELLLVGKRAGMGGKKGRGCFGVFGYFGWGMV